MFKSIMRNVQILAQKYKKTQVSQVCLRLFRGNLSLNEGDSAANAVSERNLQRKITKTRQQMQQKELAKLKLNMLSRKFVR